MLLNVLLVLLSALLIAIAAIWAVRSLPLHNAQKHIKTAAATLVSEGAYPQAFSSVVTSENFNRDNVTDLTMLSVMLGGDAEPLTDGLLAYTKVHLLGTPSDQTQALLSEVPTAYARYWHGYQVVYLPLLEVLTYNGVRIAMGLTMLALLIIDIYLLITKQKMKLEALLLIFALLITGCYMAPFSLQFSFVFVIALSVSLMFLAKDHVGRNSARYILLLSGIATAYFDLLTIPLLTLGLPLIILVSIRRKDSKSLSESYALMLSSGCYWLLGYVMFWAAKFPIVALASSNKIYADVSSEASSILSARLSDGIKAIAVNTSVLLPKELWPRGASPFIPLGIAFVILFSIWFSLEIRSRRKRVDWPKPVIAATPFLAIALFPIVWMMVFGTHSDTHYWMVNRILLVTILGLMYFWRYSLQGISKAIRHDRANSVKSG